MSDSITNDSRSKPSTSSDPEDTFPGVWPENDQSADNGYDASFGLDKAHWETLVKGSSISPEVLIEAGPVSVHNGIELMQHGFRQNVGPTPGIVFPRYTPGMNGTNASECVYRPDATVDKRKYLIQDGKKSRLSTHPRCEEQLKDSAKPLWITEGQKKMLALVSKGVCAIALDGVYSFGGKAEPGHPILNDWEHVALNGRQVKIAYDSTTRHNPDEMQALHQHTAFLKKRGALVQWAIVPDARDGSKQGVDDYFVAGYSMEDLGRECVEPDANPLIGAKMDDLGNGERFAYMHAGETFWNRDAQKWFCWDGKRWAETTPEMMLPYAKATIRQTQIDVALLPVAYPKRDELVDFAGKLGSRYKVEAMIAFAKGELAVTTTRLDTDPWLFNCANGTIDLRTGELRPHDPDDLITKLCPVEYDPDAECPTWIRYLRRVMSDNEQMLNYLQKLVGIFITGSVKEKFLPIIWGLPDTGKTTFTNILRALLSDDYAQVMGEGTVAEVKRKADGGDASPDIARLKGVRLAIVSETDEGMRLNAARVKVMTGRNRMMGRFLHANLIEFEPTHKILIETNHRPLIPTGDDAVWARIHLIPFENVIPRSEQDPDLEDTLREELSGILAWAVSGCLKWQEEGLGQPPEIEEATKKYREEEDPLKDFVSEALVESAPAARLGIQEGFKAYQKWADGDKYAFGRKRFAALMDRRFERDPQKRFWVGIGKSDSATPTQFEKIVGGGE
jgi:P4 family phage/plasmid primase-like protien